MELRPHQNQMLSEGIEILKRYKILYIRAEPRTGKTITSFAIAEKYGAKNVIFVTKKKAISSIESDAKHFSSLNVTVVNYESLHKCAAHNADLIIYDEVHCTAAFPKASARQKEARKKAANLPVIMLSGTPTPESFSQIFHQLQISAYSPYRNYPNFYKWANIYVRKQTKYVYNREIIDYSNANSERILNEIGHLFVTCTQNDAGFDVSIDEKILIAPMPESLKEDIKTLRKHKVLDSIIADTAVKEMSKVHQLSSGTVIDENGEYFIKSDFKAVFLKSFFKDRKIVIFYKFKSELTLLMQHFNYTLDVDEFQKSKNKVFLGQFVSSREGVRLDTAEAIVFFNIDFSALSYLQAKERIISKERTSQATLYWCFSDYGIEQKIYEVVKNKQDYTLKHYVRS